MIASATPASADVSIARRKSSALGGGDHVDRVRSPTPPAGRNARQARAQPRGEARRPRGRPPRRRRLHRIPGPPALVTIATRLPRGARLRRQQRRDVEQLGERVGADHAGLAEQRVDGDVRGGQQRAGVRRGRARAGGRAAALDRDDRLACARPGGRSGRTCAGSRTTRGTAGSPSVSGSCSQYWRKSLPERSALLPIDTNDDRPSRRRLAASTIAIPRPPLCDRNPTLPGASARGA